MSFHGALKHPELKRQHGLAPSGWRIALDRLRRDYIPP